MFELAFGGEDAQQEELELVDVLQLDAKGLAEVRTGALELEKRAYDISKEVYGQTAPAEQTASMEDQ